MVRPDNSPNINMTTLVSLCKRRGFVFPASEIYGGIGSTWDYGPLGVQLQRNIKDAWWNSMVNYREDIVGLDSAIIQNPEVWRSSGHAEGFTDPLVECTSCHHRFGEPCSLYPPRQCPLAVSRIYDGGRSLFTSSPTRYDPCRTVLQTRSDRCPQG